MFVHNTLLPFSGSSASHLLEVIEGAGKNWRMDFSFRGQEISQVHLVLTVRVVWPTEYSTCISRPYSFSHLSIVKLVPEGESFSDRWRVQLSCDIDDIDVVAMYSAADKSTGEALKRNELESLVVISQVSYGRRSLSLPELAVNASVGAE